MKTHGEIWREHLRIAILRILDVSPGYSLNESLLHDLLLANQFRLSRDQVRGELAWLADAGLVATEDLGELILATATKRGVEVARGIVTHPGVKRPSAKG